MYSHPLYYQWQRKRRIVNAIKFWTPVFCALFLAFYLGWFVWAVAK